MVKPFQIPEKPYEAFLYDCDGTLADSMVPHIEAWVEAVGRHRVRIPGSLITELAGMPATKTVEEINRRYGSRLDPEKIAQEKEDLFHDHYLHRVTAIDSVVENLKANHGKVKIGIVSGGRTRIVHKTLEMLGIANLVDVVICAEDVAHGKPDPEPYLIAAARLGIHPDHCLVFEDGELGIQSAMNAGMDWVRIENDA